jgi:hypothetical protein
MNATLYLFYALYPHMTVWENIGLDAEPWVQMRAEVARIQRHLAVSIICVRHDYPSGVSHCRRRRRPTPCAEFLACPHMTTVRYVTSAAVTMRRLKMFTSRTY